MPKIPTYQPRISPETPRINAPDLVSARSPEAAFGGQVAEAQGGISKPLAALADVFAKRAEQVRKLDEAVYASNVETAFLKEFNGRMYSDDVETSVVGGQKVKRPKGFLNRKYNDASNSVFELDDWYQKRRSEYVGAIRDPETQLKVMRSMDSSYQTNRNALIKHEVQQRQAYREESQSSLIKIKQENFSSIQTPEGLSQSISDLEDDINLLSDIQGLDDNSRELKRQEEIEKAVKASLNSFLITDPSGKSARNVLASVDDKLSQQRKETLNKLIDNEVKKNAKVLEDELQIKFNNGELKIEDIIAANRPKTDGGIGGSAAKTLIKALTNEQKSALKDIRESDALSSQYIDLIDAMISDQVDRFNFNNLLIDFYANDGVLDPEEKKLISGMKDKLLDLQFNRASNVFVDSVKAVKSWMGNNNPSDEDLIDALRKMMNFNKDLNKTEEEMNDFTSSLIRSEQMKINPNAGKYAVGDVAFGYKVEGIDEDGEPLLRIA